MLDLAATELDVVGLSGFHSSEFIVFQGELGSMFGFEGFCEAFSGFDHSLHGAPVGKVLLGGFGHLEFSSRDFSKLGDRRKRLSYFAWGRGDGE